MNTLTESRRKEILRGEFVYMVKNCHSAKILVTNYKAGILSVPQKNFNLNQWLEQSQAHMRSSLMLREAGKNLKDFLGDVQSFSKNENILTRIFDKETAYKSSVLLTGYALELALKSGVINFYCGLPHHLLERDLKKHNHNLKDMAIDLNINLSKTEQNLLEDIKAFITSECRYPLSAEDHQTYAAQLNKRNSKLQSETLFQDIQELYEKIYEFVRRIDNDTGNPVSFHQWAIDKDGYLVYRFGGNIPSRMTVQYSSQQVQNKGNNIRALKECIERNQDHTTLQILMKKWNMIEQFYEYDKNGELKNRNNESKKSVTG
jgi:hypothetical protein